MSDAALTSADEIAAKAEELDAIRRRVINVIGHELRTSVTTIHGLAQQVCSASDLAASGIETAIPVGSPQTVDLAVPVTEVWTTRTDAPLDLEVLDIDAPEAEAVAAPGGPTARIAEPVLHPEEVRLAVEPFFRGERAVTSRPGLGLGLAIAHELAGHLGGSLRFEATASGTVTTLVVPL